MLRRILNRFKSINIQPVTETVFLRPFSNHMIKFSEEEGQTIFVNGLRDGTMNVIAYHCNY